MINVLVLNPILTVTLSAMVVAQVMKVAIAFIVHGKADFRRFISMGGMPSSHSSTVVALAVCVARKLGIESVEFAITFTLALIVMYDAAGVRRAAGQQARVLNKILENWNFTDPNLMEIKLKELLGHTPLQVLIGGVVGFIIAMVIRV